MYKKRILVEPSRPALNEDGIGEDHFNISFIPGEFDSDEQRPVGNRFYAKVREEGETDWRVSFRIEAIHFCILDP